MCEKWHIHMFTILVKGAHSEVLGLSSTDFCCLFIFEFLNLKYEAHVCTLLQTSGNPITWVNVQVASGNCQTKETQWKR